ncbi:hypothetical protein TcCL_Unassigned03740 [Trypanosoma cruzi]|nr:hypothetical protein TcCL_Unassigned03740 [Trypanosoma cruzi]
MYIFVRPSTYSAPSFLLLCFVFQQAHTHTQDAHCSGYECSFCSACWQLRVAAVVFFRGHEEKGGEGARTPSLFSCGCGAPRVAALSWAPCPIEGGMAGNFVAASWTDEGSLARVAGVVAAVFLPFPWGCGDELGEMVVDVFSSCMVGGCWRCVPSLRGWRLVVCELCGWACCPLLMFSALTRCIRCTPSLSLLFHSFSSVLTDQLTDTSDSTYG